MNECKTKSENKNAIREHRYFFESKFAEVNRLFVLIYSNQDDNDKSYNTRGYYFPKGTARNYNDIINGKNFYDQPN